jgi:hypothetical protein
LGRFAFGRGRIGSFSAGVTFPLIDPVWVFLASSRFAAKTPDYEGWISLDSLVRIVTYQWVKRDNRATFFPRAFVVAAALLERLADDLAWRRDELLIGQA